MIRTRESSTGAGSGYAIAPKGRDGRFDRFAALAVLTVFGVTWPVLDLLGRNAEFFLARRSPTTEIIGLALVCLVVVPAVVGLVGSLPGRAGRWLGIGLIAVTAVSLSLLYLRLLPVPWWASTMMATLAGIALTWSFVHIRSVRQTARYLLAAPLILLAVFLLTMPVADVLREPDLAIGNPVPVAAPAPVVLVVFDEFPLASIIDPAGKLRADRYPHFARLANDGIWFRNAMTVEQQTEHSVPAILTGSVPDQSLIPVTGNYPFNLFTALRDTFDLHVQESITQLCPRALCEGLTRSATSLVSDLGVIGGHLLLPKPLTDDLPAIDRGWGDFQSVTGDFDARAEFRAELREGQTAPIDRFLDDMSSADTDHPSLFYLHAIVPHHPWQFLPDGRSYPFIVGENPASESGGWIDDDFLVAQSMQRHLLQVGYADHVLGRIISTLEAKGIYDDALVIVVADHGISIRPGVDHQRIITDSNVGEIAAVPLFVKPPGGRPGLVDDRRALTIDILPTIADVIDARLPDEVEGVSLLGPSPDRKSTTTMGTHGPVTFGVDGSEKLQVARRIESIFPDGDPWSLRPSGSPNLVGEVVDTVALASSPIRWHLREAQLYDSVSLSSEVIPVRVGGVLSGDVDGSEVLAVVINGSVGAVTRSYDYDGEIAFLAMVPPEFFKDGQNSIDLVEVSPDGHLLHVANE